MAEALKDAQIADPGKVAASDSLLPIMHGQRERYRQRAQELETVRYVIVLLIWVELFLCRCIVCSRSLLLF